MSPHEHAAPASAAGRPPEQGCGACCHSAWLGETTLGALNLYAHLPRAFGATDRAKGLIFATHAGVALAAAVELEDATRALEVETQRLQNLTGRCPLDR